MPRHPTVPPSPAAPAATPSMALTLERARTYATLPADVLLIGPTGSGKGHLARLLHTWSGRRGAWVEVPGGELTETLWASELFGHLRGAYTGAAGERRGAFARAAEGTLFLDELHHWPRAVQSALLRPLQARRFVPLGAEREVEMSCRILFATTSAPAALVETGRLPEDLAYRLPPLVLEVPPLRARRGEILPFLEAATTRALAHFGWDAARFRYDPFSRRVLKVTGTTTRDSLWFVYNAGVQVLVDFTGNGAADTVRAEYGYGPGSDQVWAVRKPGTGLDGVLLLDPLIGSVRGVAAWTGGTLQKDYRKPLGQAGPWGRTPADTGAVLRVRWAGREYDQETGLYYMRARYYDPRLGRFLSEDPIGVEGGLNLHAYAGDDPVNSADPFGLSPLCVFKVVGSDTTWGVEEANGKCRNGTMPEIGVPSSQGPVDVIYLPIGNRSFGYVPAGEGFGPQKDKNTLPRAPRSSRSEASACDVAILRAALSVSLGMIPMVGSVALRGSGFVRGMVSITQRSGHLASSVPLLDATLVPSIRGGAYGGAGLVAGYGAARYAGDFSFGDALSAVVSLSPIGALGIAMFDVYSALNTCTGS